MSKVINMKRFRDYQKNQILLFPPSINDWLPENHPARFINEVAEQLDLRAIYNDYSELRGKPPYHPQMMVKIWIYACSKGILSSRKEEGTIYDDVGFRYLSANQLLGPLGNLRIQKAALIERWEIYLSKQYNWLKGRD